MATSSVCLMKRDEIIGEIVRYLRESVPAAAAYPSLPMDDSLYELGVLDSFGVVELVAFLEKRWRIQIFDSEITKEKFGSIHKMARLVEEKLLLKPVSKSNSDIQLGK